MAKKQTDQAAGTDEILPTLGGSYTRNSDGSLTRNEFTLHPGDEGYQSPAPAQDNPQPTTGQE